MINLSRAFKRELYYNRRNYLSFADITLSNGRTISLTDTQIWSGGFSLEDAVSEDNSFTALGSTIIGAATLIINNMDERYSGHDFTNAKVNLYVGMNLKDGNTTRLEKIRKGVYTVDGTSYNGGTITLTLLDNMEQFDRPYTTNLVYPSTLDAIVRDACLKCGVSLNTYDFPHKDYVVQERPQNDSTTYREVIGWAAAIAGCFARCNRDGKLELKWFNQTALENRTNVIDAGESFNTTGSLIDGGGFNTSYDLIDGGNLYDDDGMHYIHSLYSQDISMDDVVITGVAVTVKDETDEGTSATKTFTSGSDGYVIGIDNNDFITTETAQDVVTWLGAQLIGLTFRKSSVTHANDPSIEAGDIGILWDRKDREHPILITRSNFAIGTSQTTVCGAETPSRNNATRYGWATKAYVESRKELNKEKTIRELMLKDLSDKLAAHSGLYSTIETGENGGKIYYLHDMPTLDESAIVWKMTTEAWGVTTNYNKGVNTQWNGGMTVDGDVIARILSAIGVNADWITTGTLQDPNGNVMFNLSTGTLTMNKGSINIGNGQFKVSESGKLTCQGADIQGTFNAGSSSGKWIRLNNSGELAGGYGSTQYGYIDFSANIYDYSMSQYLKGIQIQGDILRINTYRIAAVQSSNVSTQTINGGTGWLQFVESVQGNSDGSITWYYNSVRFINGLMCSELSS